MIGSRAGVQRRSSAFVDQPVVVIANSVVPKARPTFKVTVSSDRSLCTYIIVHVK